MKITMVLDQYNIENNGTTVTIKRFTGKLKEHGHKVNIISVTPPEDETGFKLKEYKLPFFTNLIHSHGFMFGKSDKKVIENAIKGSDVVHLAVPFGIEKTTLKLCKKHNIAHTAAFHCQPENVTSSLGLRDFKPANEYIYRLFRRTFYNKVRHVHCPSQFIADELIKHKYNNIMHVISNGADAAFKPVESVRPDKYKDKILIHMNGRLSDEKRHDVLIDGVNLSKYRDKIQIVNFGRGPLLKKLTAYGKKLPNPPEFLFVSKDELVQRHNYADLYVHSSDIEIEAIGCVEAFCCGLVPIIANSPRSATKQFALTEHNLFERGNPQALADKIDYLIEHPELKAELSQKYIEYGKKFQIDYCVKQFEQMFRDAIADNKAEQKEKIQKIKQKRLTKEKKIKKQQKLRRKK